MLVAMPPSTAPAHTKRRITNGILVLALVSCSAAPAPTAPSVANSIPRVDAEHYRFLGKDSGQLKTNDEIEWGDAPGERPAVGTTAQITIGIRLDVPGGTPRRWRVRLLYLAESSTPYRGLTLNGQALALASATTAVMVVEQKPGAPSESWTRSIPIGAFAAGFIAAINARESVSRNPNGEPDLNPRADRERLAKLVSGLVCGMTLAAPFQEDSSLRDIAFAVCKVPSYLSIALSLGVQISVDFRFEEAIRMPERVLAGTPSNRPIYSLPVTVFLNGTPGLECRVLVTDPSPPLTLIGGFLGLVGEQPGNPEYRVSAKVISASSGIDPKVVEPFRAAPPSPEGPSSTGDDQQAQ